MISDLFDGTKCKNCGCSWEYGSSEPLMFERVDIIELDDGIDYLCKCTNCDYEFTLQYVRAMETKRNDEKRRYPEPSGL
jgi:hypothetical protein